MKKILLSSLAILLLVTGCKQTPKLENGKEKVVSFNEGGIAVDDLYEEMKSKYALNILLDMIDKQITDEKYKTTDEEKEYIENQKKNEDTYYSVLYSSQYQTFEQYIRARYGVSTTAELEDIYRLSYRRTQAVKDYIREHLTESEIKDYYDNSFIGDIEASHILITADYDDNATNEQKQEAENKALETAKEVIKKLNEGGDFASLAKEYSKDEGTASNGGALGKFGHGYMESEFEEAAYKLEVGKYTTEPVKTRFGYHIILKTKEYEKDKLEDAKEEIKDALVDKKLQETDISYKTLIDVRDDYGLTIEDSVLKEQYENYKYNYGK